jgi:diguanylate cyclase (GGDEF)-like protein
MTDVSHAPAEQVTRSTGEGCAHLDELPLPVVEFTPELVVTYANGAAGRLLGRDPDGVVGVRLPLLLDPAEELHHTGLLEDAIAALGRAPEAPTGETVVSLGGQRRWTRWTFQGRFEGATVVAVRAVGLDVTDQWADELRHAAILDQAAEAILTTDTQGRIISANQAALAIFGAEYASGLLGQEIVWFLRGGEVAGWAGRRLDGVDFPVEVSHSVVDTGVEPIETWIVRDVSERVALEARLRHQARHDPLTGLVNRSAFVEQLQRELQRSDRSRSRVGVLYVDLDRFKSVNDRFGHSSGDDLLREVARRLGVLARGGDIVARFGGDEFALLATDLRKPDDALQLASRVRQALEDPIMLDGGEAFIGASIGVAIAELPTIDPEALVDQADAALYRAKARGRNRMELYDEVLQRAAEDRREKEAALQGVVQRGELELEFQPIVELSSTRVIGVEALVRWNRPDIGVVPPDEFISVAEDSGLVLGIGEWVLEESCRALRAIDEALPGRDLRIAVNFSPRQIIEPGIALEIARTVERIGVDPSRITFEITERLLFLDTGGAVETLWDLRNHGFGLALDDFGTGYSSLTYLRRFPVDIVKIDRSFVAAMIDSADDARIVAMVAALAQALDLSVVAEGVERPEQVLALMDLDVGLVQGFLFARPMPLPALLDHLRLQP